MTYISARQGTNTSRRKAPHPHLPLFLLLLALAACQPMLPPAETVPALAQPVDLADYPAAIQQMLNAGDDLQTLERTLTGWEALPDAPGQLAAADLTGDGELEIVAALRDPRAEIPAGDLLIFGLRGGAYTLLHPSSADARLAIRLLQVADTNGDGHPDVAYTRGECGAHTCFETLEILTWEGSGFASLMGGKLAMPHPTYGITPGRIEAQSGLVGSVGAEPQRGYGEAWEWNGSVFTVTQQIWDPPIYRYHALLDGDHALFAGEYATAIAAYNRVIDDPALQEWGTVSGSIAPAEERGRLAALARWRLVLVHLQAGDPAGAQSAYDRLLAAHPAGATGHDAAALAQVFWTAYAASGRITDGCIALVDAAKTEPATHDFFNQSYGYANPRWEAVDLCPFVE